MRDASFGNSAGADTVTLNLADVIDFSTDSTTGETFGVDAIDLVFRGDSDDTVNLAVGSGFTLVGNQALTDPIYGGAGVTYNIYQDGAGHVIAVEDTVVTNT